MRVAPPSSAALSRARASAILLALVSVGCSGENPGSPRPTVVQFVSKSATVVGNTAKIYAPTTPGSTLTVSFGEDSRCSRTGVSGPSSDTLRLTGLAYETQYWFCVRARSNDGESAEITGDFKTHAAPTVEVVMEFRPLRPSGGLILDMSTGYNFDGSMFLTQKESSMIITYDEGVSYKRTFTKVKPNLPHSATPNTLRIPMFRLGPMRHVGYVSPADGEFRLNGVRLTKTGDPLPAPECSPDLGCVPGPGIIFHVDSTGKVTDP